MQKESFTRRLCAMSCGTFVAVAYWVGPVGAQSLEIVDDENQVVAGSQTVNVGEHVTLKVRANPPSLAISNPQWLVTGTHLADWITKDGNPAAMSLSDYLQESIHFMWKDVTTPTTPNVVYVSAQTSAGVLSLQINFNVVHEPKAEKVYSDDLLMENHNNWHSVYMFWNAASRRGDLFLGWHRSQLEYFEKWRTYFGYPPVLDWDPVTPWTAAPEPAAQQHPGGSPAPQQLWSQRHDLITLDLTDQNLATATEGEYDLTTHAQGRGRRQAFGDAGYVLRTETVRELLCEDPGFPCTGPAFSRNGPADLPTWWQPDTGQTASDPWFQAGCPARANPDPTAPVVQTCAPQSKTSLEDYTFRELGESIESGLYASNFAVNYHALGHIAASEDMSNPVTSMRDSIFWAWHKHLDGTLSAWKQAKGEEEFEALGDVLIYTKPSFLEDWTKLRVAFSHRIIGELIQPHNVLVNGSAATGVTDVSFTGTGYIFEFTGFGEPADGVVTVVVRREVDNDIRTTPASSRPAPTMIMTRFGGLLQPAMNQISYTKP